MSLSRWIVMVSLVWVASGCVYTGAARNLTPKFWENERGWIAVERVPLLKQRDEHECGPTALAMVLGYWQPQRRGQYLSGFPANQRISVGDLRDRARASGFSSFVVAGTVDDVVHEIKARRPVIVGLAKPTSGGRVAHYEVVVGVHPESRRIATLDPSAGWRQNSFEGFLREWLPTGQVLLVVLPPEPAPATRDAHSSARLHWALREQTWAHAFNPLRF